MHVPPAFARHDADGLAAFVAAHPLACLVVNGEDGPVAAHCPMAWRRPSGPEASDAPRTLIAHVARSNPFWRRAQAQPRALAIFTGPDAYVSAGYYPSKAEHGRVVPTWNYIRVEARGVLEVIEDPRQLLPYVATPTEEMERGRAHPWSVADAPADYIEALLRAVVGLRFEVEHLEGAWKLSQNKSEADAAGVFHGLANDPSPLAPFVADAVRAARNA